VKPDVILTSLNADESGDVTIQTLGTGAETGTFAAHTNGWIAVQVTGALPATTGTFDISAATAAAVTYTNTLVNVPFVSICTGGLNTVTMHADDTIFGSPDDEGLSDTLAAPTGFTFFGASVGGFQISTNGWLSFQTGQTDAQFENVTMPTPDIPNAVIAPYWTDLAGVQVCAKTIGTSTTIEWQGDSFVSGDVSAFQVQLNGVTGTITYVYGAAQADDGGDATVGVEDFAGANAGLFEFDTATTVAPSTARRFTPM
jgi:hypothetical protein